MEQLSFDFVQNPSPKEFQIHSKLPIRKLNRGYSFVHVSKQANVDVRKGDLLTVTATERRTDVCRARVLSVWKGQLMNLPASTIRFQENELKTFEQLQEMLYDVDVNTNINYNYGYTDEVIAIEYAPLLRS